MTINYLKPLAPPLPDPYVEGSWEANFFDEMFWPPAAPVGQIKFWDGAAFVSKPAKHWTGAAWVTKPVRRWGGSAWSPPPTVPPPTIASIVDASAKDATYLNYNDNSKMSQLYTEPPGNVNNGDTVAKCLPSAGALRSETQTSLWQYRPVWQANGGVGRLFFGDTFDPGHSLYGITSLNPNTTLIIVAQLSNVKKTSFFERFNGINYVWKAESGSTDPHASHPGSPTFRIDGAAFNGNSGALYNLNTDLQRHIYTAENLDFTGRTDGSLVLANSAFTGFHLNGYIYDVVLVSDISVDERNTIEAELAAKHSITLP